MVYRGGSSFSNWLIGILVFKDSLQLTLLSMKEIVMLSTGKVTSMVDLVFLTKKFNQGKPRTNSKRGKKKERKRKVEKS